jgi:serine/threonine protein kinase
MDAVEALHRQSIIHRDLKLENLLFDKDYNIKVADFGFGSSVKGRDGSGLLKTRTGTTRYMPPEMHLERPYNGVFSDLFSLGVILFTLVAKLPPFSKANPMVDNYYKAIAENRFDLFWRAHAKFKQD